MPYGFYVRSRPAPYCALQSDEDVFAIPSRGLSQRQVLPLLNFLRIPLLLLRSPRGNNMLAP